jgi:hypothetical protein
LDFKKLSFLWLVHYASFISTVKTRFFNRALTGNNPAIDRGSPTWRRSVPISTTSSSPFLNNPISPLVANGSSTRTSYAPFCFPKVKGFSVRVTADGSSPAGYQHSCQLLQSLSPQDLVSEQGHALYRNWSKVFFDLMQNLVLRGVPLVEPGIADFIREQAVDDDHLNLRLSAGDFCHEVMRWLFMTIGIDLGESNARRHSRCQRQTSQKPTSGPE